MTRFQNKGIGLVEVVVGAGLIFVVFSGIVSVFNFYLTGAVSLTDNIKAEFLAEEGLEALRSIRDDDWAVFSSIAREQEHSLYFSGTVWQLGTTTEVVDSVFTRSFEVRDVLRNGSGLISPSGTVDPDTLLVEVTVAWEDRGKSSERKISTYLANVLEI